jgi:hypothetical protein
MNNNIIKIWILALGIFGFWILLSQTKAAEGTVSLTIIPGVSSCSYGTSINFGSQEIQMDQSYTFAGTFTGAFWCIDRNGITAQRTFTMIAQDLSASGVNTKISSGNVKIFHSAAVSSGNGLACTGNQQVLQENAIPLNQPYTILQRLESWGEGICSVAIANVGLKVEVPANQAPGIYTGTLTLDISL